MRSTKSMSSLHILLKALIPYSRENIRLSFHPNAFFNQLEKQSGYTRKTFQNTLKIAERNGYISRDDKMPRITAKGLEELKPFEPKKLIGNAQLMVIFDIPEENARLRRKLRALLREWKFKLVQKSVWVSNYDCKNELVSATKELGLEECVKIYECAKLFPK